ncbi:uric acid degradation bifunctional protein TTL isoform X2 [Euphorbia lathyris]|uniref:uric acid degradation bifunctional protein TTL isoform X2 n=1 Tax=Euphorbia lathyris TaxID=212925 RepID=UPI0033138B50
MESVRFEEKDFFACCGSTKFAEDMAQNCPFISIEEAITVAKSIWFNEVNVHGWLEAFSSHPQIGQSPSPAQTSDTASQWSKGEQSTALATATISSSQELSEWNTRYKQKFGFVFLICASGRSTAEILAELKKRYQNRPIIELENAAQEQMKITELRLAKLFATKRKAASIDTVSATKVEDRLGILGGHLTANPNSPSGKSSQIMSRTRPPITTHVLDVSLGCPAAGVEVRLDVWKGARPRPLFGETDIGGWSFLGSSATNTDGRSGQLMNIVDAVDPGIYRISFNTGKYCPSGFFPYVSIVFDIKESQRMEHFHVPLLLSPFSFSTYRGS